MKQLVIAVAILFVSSHSNAGLFSWCKKNIFSGWVEEDPAPYVHYENDELLRLYRFVPNETAKIEIIYRVKMGLLHPLMLGDILNDVYFELYPERKEE